MKMEKSLTIFDNTCEDHASLSKMKSKLGKHYLQDDRDACDGKDQSTSGTLAAGLGLQPRTSYLAQRIRPSLDRRERCGSSFAQRDLPLPTRKWAMCDIPEEIDRKCQRFNSNY
jgi:hypothetical protein